MNLPRDNPIIRETDPFARPKERIAWRQVSVITGLFVVSLAVLYWQRHSPWQWAMIPVLSACFMRMFVLFHDCGHGSLFRSYRANAWVGRAFGCVMGISFDGWHTEHSWHHRNQGRLDRRGIDIVNSPMTALEAVRDPARAAARARRIKARNIIILGLGGIFIERKTLKGFFPFRPKFQWPVPNRASVVRNFRLTIGVHAVFHLAFLAVYGWVTWLTVLLPSFLIAGGFGVLLFWVQHNFPRTYHAEAADWSFADVALQGSSYVALQEPFAWITAHIGLHHVHHLNPRIPNYNLEAARRAIPSLNAVKPLQFHELSGCFTQIFWDEAKKKMIGIGELRSGLK